MKLIFNVEHIKYIQISCKDENGDDDTFNLAFKEKSEGEIIALAPVKEAKIIKFPQEIELKIICENCTYSTNTMLENIETHNESVYYIFKNPATTDYLQNRAFFRILASYDCIYTIETENGAESYNATTYDLSAGGVSIIMEQNIISRHDAKILLMMENCNLRAYVKFLRSELYGENSYKLSFRFVDLSEKTLQILEQLCINKQLKTEENK